MSGKTHTFKKAISYPLLIIKQLALLPKSIARLDNLHKDFLETNHISRVASEDLQKFQKQDYEKSDQVNNKMNSLDERLTDVLHQLSTLGEVSPNLSVDSSNKSLIANDHSLDNFYVTFEKWFRGSEAEITERQSIYLPYFKQSKIDSKQFPAIDIGCGNGEFVGLLHKNKIRAIGLDLNKAMVQNVRKKDLEAEQGDALTYLKSQKSNSLMAITGFHIVEHIPFVDLVKIFNECYRTLKPGGFIIFETPNPENVIVGSCNFYSDPSHLHPIPPAFLELVAKTRGFQKTEIKRLHPIKSNIKSDDPLLKEIAERMYGPQDYSVIAYK